ncbi:MAG: glycoside hydrolase family 127 protein, partial [Anaerolineae bacterium]|nr:glycoside hydrolase family 127 protein [Anaerolineae bacterium]
MQDGRETLNTLTADPQGAIYPFNYEGVRLGPSRWRDQYQHTRDYFLAIPDDDILKGFRQRAGLPAPGQDMGGWYSGDDKDQWHSPGDIFHTFGQWLSGLSRMAKVIGDVAMREKVLGLMAEWAKTIAPDGYFFFSDHPNAPHYTYEKTCGGLVDIAQYLGNQDALRHLEKITHWAIKNLGQKRSPATHDDFAGSGSQKPSEWEWYTLSENLYRAYRLTGDPMYKDFAQVWHYTPYWDALARGEDAFLGKHAYSHVNTLSGAAMAFAVTGERKYFDAIANAYRILWDHHLFVTGGYGPRERFSPPDGSLGKSLDFIEGTMGLTPDSSAETTCGSWAGFKLTRYLAHFTGRARYSDWTERLLYNCIGASLPMTGRGCTFYYSSYMMADAHKSYVPVAWPCCSGTYPMAVADYHNIVYYRDAGGLYVNLFLPSEVTWTHD